MSLIETLSEFKNESYLNFADAQPQALLDQALARVSSQLGATYPLVIAGQRRRARRVFASVNPSERAEVIGHVQQADRGLADQALAAAAQAFEVWRHVPQTERAKALLRMAESLRQRRYEFIAWLILEVGKNAREADAEVAEAIDFMEYYARLSLRPPTPPTPVTSERNANVLLPLGVVVVLPPWNFPLAILAGMTLAAVVTGNTVVLKPSSQSPVIAAKFMELVEEAGLPPGVINLLTGSGRAIGDFLVGDARTRMIAFTGSKQVGLHINQLAARPVRGQRWIKRVIAEMGGKNAILVDASADLDQAVDAVAASTYGYQGQKCSACSRAVVHESLYKDFVERLAAKIETLSVGPARELRHFMGPVISAEAQRGIQKQIARGKLQAKLRWGGQALFPRQGFYLQPTLFENPSPSAALLQEEIFGPVLALVKVRSFAEALKRANDTVYGLTGAVFARDRSVLEQAKREFFCGNLYLNRKCTGAMVGGHPFGGFNLSGTDSKAGGPDYLLLFQQGQSISERV